MLKHPFPPLYDAHSRILILGSFPSVKSREMMFFYGHPQNRFWHVLKRIFESDSVPMTVEARSAFLLKHHIAVWDVLASCEIRGSADSSIRDAEVNDLTPIFETASIDAIFVNGKTAKQYYDRYLRDRIGREAICLPSTSPANAAWSLDRLTEAWSVIKQ